MVCPRKSLLSQNSSSLEEFPRFTLQLLWRQTSTHSQGRGAQRQGIVLPFDGTSVRNGAGSTIRRIHLQRINFPIRIRECAWVILDVILAGGV